MTPEDQADFAAEIRTFSPKSIERLHRLLSRLQDESVVLTPETVKREYHAICRQDGHRTRSTDSCLRWLLDLLDTDPETPLNNKFLDVLHDAHIVLTTDATTTDGGDQSPRRAASPEPGPHPDPDPDDMDITDLVDLLDRRPSGPDSPDSLDPERDLLWHQAIVLDNRKLVSQALEQWRQKIDLQRALYLEYEDPRANHEADAHYSQDLASKSLSHWRNTVEHVQRLERVAVKLRARRDAAWVLKTWSLATREQILVRVRGERLSHAALHSWRDKNLRSVQAEIVADELATHHATRRVLERLMTKRHQIKTAESTAIRVHEGRLMQKMMGKWWPQWDQVQLNARRAAAAAEYFASKHALQIWQGQTLLREEEKRSTQARHHILAVKYSRRWRAAVKKAHEVRYDLAYRKMRRKVKVNIARAALNLWRAKTARIRQMNPMAAEFRTRHDAENARRTAHHTVIAIYNKTEHMHETRQTATLLFHKRLVLRLQLFGAAWLTPTRQMLDHRQKADDYRSTRTASYALTRMRSWRNHTFRSQRLEEDADVLWQRSQKKKVLGYLQQWSRRAVARERLEARGAGPDARALIPATPAARRSQLLASTTPAYTPAGGLFARSRLVEHVYEEET